MDLTCATLQNSLSLSLKASSTTLQPHHPSFSSLTCSILKRNPSSSSQFKGCRLPLNAFRSGRKSYLFAAAASSVGGASDVSTERKGEQELSLCSGTPEPPASSGGRDEKGGVDDQGKMISACDKLIGVFMVDKPTPTDWRRLLAFSKKWENIRPHFFDRCQQRADNEDDPSMKQKLLRLARKLKEIDEDVQRHNELLQVVRNAPSEISEVVARRRKDFTKEFFVHLFTVAQSYHDDPTEQNALAKLGNDCMASVQAYDSAMESVEALNAAELKLQDIVNSPSLDAACRKIDDLAQKNQLDSTLVMMITKAWSAAKESNMTKDEVKDVLFHLYKTAVGNLQRLMPKDIRILKYLLIIEDHDEWLCALKDAFTPGDELEGKDVDCLYTTPKKLHTWIKAVVDAYHFSQEGTLIREARDLMNPEIIKKLEELKKLVEDNYL